MKYITYFFITCSFLISTSFSATLMEQDKESIYALKILYNKVIGEIIFIKNNKELHKTDYLKIFRENRKKLKEEFKDLEKSSYSENPDILFLRCSIAEKLTSLNDLLKTFPKKKTSLLLRQK